MDGEAVKNKILIVDDSLFNQKKLENILGDSYTLKTASMAAEVFPLVDSFAPDLILLDILLPDANGFDVLTKLQESDFTRRIPVVIISGLNAEKDEEKGFLLGAVDYITKPFKDAIVKARIGTQIKLINQMRAIGELNFIDHLTGIFNRRAFESKLNYEWGRAAREGGSLSLLMIDVDRFKRYNDAYGHPQGDRMLQAVANAIQCSLNRSVDILCRYGGEEFTAILPSVDIAGAINVAERIRKSVDEISIPCLKTGEPTTATISVGVAAAHPLCGTEPSYLLSLADSMLYKAKAEGRNRIHYELDG